MNNNRTLVQKADLALSNLTNDGGLLVAEQAQQFMQILIETATVTNMATVVPMRRHKFEIDKTRFANRILRAGSSATSLSEADRAKPDLDKVELDVKLFKAEVRLNDEILEDSIEQGRFAETVRGMMMDALARDVDDVVINSDTGSGTKPAVLTQLDGILKQATSNVVNHGGARLTQDAFKNALKTLPDEYHVNKAQMRFLTSINAEMDYRDSVAQRATAYGDVVTQNAPTPLTVFGVPLMEVPLFPEDLGGGNDTEMLLLDPKNIQIGFLREIRMERDRDISAGTNIFVATLRFDVKYAHEPAVVKVTDILAS